MQAPRLGVRQWGTLVLRAHRASYHNRVLFIEDIAVTLLKWALVFFVVSLIAALFGFTDIAAASAEIARVLFYIFLVIFVVLLVLGLVLSRRF
jgi:uncharacterized membrane protein YtjA (UPF0391 family)